MNPFHIVRAALPLLGLLFAASATAGNAQEDADEDARPLANVPSEDAAEEVDEAVSPEPPGELIPRSIYCIQVITYAHNPRTGECRVFPNPCVVPPGWKKSYSPLC